MQVCNLDQLMRSTEDPIRTGWTVTWSYSFGRECVCHICKLLRHDRAFNCMYWSAVNKIIVFIRIFYIAWQTCCGCSASEWAVPLLYENLSEKLALISFDLHHRRNKGVQNKCLCLSLTCLDSSTLDSPRPFTYIKVLRYSFSACQRYLCTSQSNILQHFYPAFDLNQRRFAFH